MPLITRRSSTRALPRVSVGRCGLIFENCAFVSQNWSRLIYASFSEAVNHAITFVPTLLWVRTLGAFPVPKRYCFPAGVQVPAGETRGPYYDPRVKRCIG